MCAAIPALGLTSKLAGGLFLGSLGIGVVSTIQAQMISLMGQQMKNSRGLKRN